MISIISFGVIALIAVIFLLTFNVRSLSRSDNPKKAPKKEFNEANVPSEDTTVLSPSQNPSQTKDFEQKPLMSDEQYRNTVRQFQNPNNKAPVLPQSKKSDEEYRSALRSMSVRPTNK